MSHTGAIPAPCIPLHRVRTHHESPCLKSLQIAVGAGKSLNFSANFIQPSFSRVPNMKDLWDKIIHVVVELKKTKT